MKKWIPVALVVVLLTPVIALAQHSSKAAEVKPAAPNSPIKAIALSGQISLDGKTLVSQENDIWTVTNPNVFVGHEGQWVSVKCQLQSAKNMIQVLSLKPALMEVKSAASKSDSAFRR